MSGGVTLDSTLDVAAKVTLDNVIDMTMANALLTHTSSVTGGGLKITSSSGYVDVETVRFTADEIGIAGDTDIIQLGASSVTIRRALTVSQDTTVTGELKVMDDVIVGPSGSPNLRIYANDGNVATKGDIELEATAAAITHSGATDATTGLTIESTNGYVDVEDVRFTDAKIGVSTKADVMTLSSTSVAVSVDLDVSSDATVNGTLGVVNDLSVGDASARTFTVDASDGSLAIGTSGEFEVDGSTGDTVTNGKLAVGGAVAGGTTKALYVTGDIHATQTLKVEGSSELDDTLQVSGGVTLDSTLDVAAKVTLDNVIDMTMANALLTHTSSVTGGGLKITSSSGYVDVETVRFTADEIGIAGDTDIIQLGASSVTIRRALTVSQDTTVTGELKVMDDVIVGPSGSPNLRIYANDGNVATKGDIELEATAAAITHSGATDATTGLTIESTNGYVDVEDVRFTDAKIGVSTKADVMTLSSTSVAVSVDLDVSSDATVNGTLGVVNDLSVGDASARTFTVDASDGSLAIGTSGEFEVDGSTGDTVTNGKLAVGGAVAGGTTKALYVTGDIHATQTLKVEGSSELDDTLQVSGGVTLDSTLDVAAKVTLDNVIDMTMANALLTHTSSVTGGGLKITSSSGYVDVETVRFTADEIGIAGDTDIIQLGASSVTIRRSLSVTEPVSFDDTLVVSGNVDLDSTFDVAGTSVFQDDISLSKSNAQLTHSASSGGLSISSTSGYVDVEGVRFIGESMGTDGHPDLITFTNGVVTINGTIVHTGTTDHSGDFEVGTNKFEVSATSGDTSVAGTMSVASDLTVGNRFSVTATSGDVITNGKLTIGSAAPASNTAALYVDGDADVTGNVEVSGTLTQRGKTTFFDDIDIASNAHRIKHIGSDGLTIESTNGYVDVEDVRFTDAKIGVSTKADVMTLSSTSVAVSVDLDVSSDATVNGTLGVVNDLSVGDASARTFTVDASDGSLAIGTSGEFEVDGSTGDTVTNGKLAVGGAVAGGTTKALYVTGDIHATQTLKVEGSSELDDTLQVSGGVTLDSTLDVAAKVTLDNVIDMTMANALLTHTSSVTGGGLKITSSSGYVDVETVRFTADEIGIAGDTDIIQLGASSVTIRRALTVSQDTTVTGELKVMDDVIVGPSGSPNLRIYANDGNVATKGDIELEATAAAITHSGATDATTGLTIESTNGYVDVEDVRFTDAKIGVSTKADVMTLSSTSVAVSVDLDVSSDATVNGTLGVVNDLSVGDASARTFTVDASDGSLAIGTSGEFEVDGSTGDTVTNGKLAVGGAVAGGTTKALYVTGDIHATQTLKVEGSSELDDTLQVSGGVTLDSTLDVAAKVTLDNVIDMTMANALLTHTSSVTGGGLKITSSSGYVDVETVRFTADEIGIAGDTDIIQLGASSVTIRRALTVSQDTTVTGELKVMDDVIVGPSGSPNLRIYANDGNVATKGDIELEATAAAITHSGATDATTGLTIESTNGYVDVEDVRFTDAKIGVSTKADVMTLSSTSVAVSVDLDVSSDATVNGTLGVVNDLSVGDASARTFTVDASDGSLAIGTSGEFEVDGSTGDTVTNGKLAVGGAVAGGTTKALYVTGDIHATQTLKVEGSSELDDTLQVSGGVTLDSTLDVAAKVTLDNVIDMTMANALLTHTSSVTGGGLKITSSSGYVDVETVRFTADEIGIAGDTDIIQLGASSVTIRRALTVSQDTTVTGELKVMDDVIVGPSGSPNLRIYANDGNVVTKGDIELEATAAAITHSGATDATTGLTIESTNGYVDVEDVRFTDAKIGVSTKADVMTLSSTSVAVSVDLDVSSDATVNGTLGVVNDLSVGDVSARTFTVDASDGSLAIGTSGEFEVDGSTGDTVTNGKLAVGGAVAGGTTKALYVTGDIHATQTLKVEGSSELDDTLQVSGGVTLDSTLDVAAKVTLDNVIDMTMANALLTHTSSVTGGGLKITSSSGYVDVETVRFTADEIGIAGDTDIIQLGASSVTIRRALTVSQDTTVTGELKVMDDVIVGPSGSPNLRIYANDGNVATKGDIELEATAAAITHSGATDATTGLTIESTNGYVDVEDVRFTDAKIGVSTKADVMTLSSTSVAVSVDLDVSSDATVSGTLGVVNDLSVGDASARTFTVDASDGSLAIGTSGEFEVDGSTGDTVTNGKLAVGGAVAGGTTKALYVTGDIHATQNLDIEGDVSVGLNSEVTIDASSGNTDISGSVDVHGQFAAHSDVRVGPLRISQPQDRRRRWVAGDRIFARQLHCGRDKWRRGDQGRHRARGHRRRHHPLRRHGCNNRADYREHQRIRGRRGCALHGRQDWRQHQGGRDDAV